MLYLTPHHQTQSAPSALGGIKSLHAVEGYQWLIRVKSKYPDRWPTHTISPTYSDIHLHSTVPSTMDVGASLMTTN